MQPPAVGADQHEPGEHGDERPVDPRVRGRRELERGDPVEGRASAPDRRAEQPRRLRDERILQVREDDVVPALGDLRVERERPQVPVERIGEPGHGPLPPGTQCGRSDQAVRLVGQRRLVGEGQGRVHDAADVGRGDVQFPDARVELVMQLADLVAQVTLGAQQARGRLRRDLQRVDEPRPAEHPGLDRVREHGVDAAEILAFGRDLPRDPGQVLQVAGVGALGFFVPAGADEVGDLYLVGLAVPVHAADPLFEPVGVERDVVVDDPVAVPLQVDALARGVGREQDAHRVAVQAGLERGLEVLALVLVHAAEQQAEPVPAQAPRRQDAGEPLLGGLVLGEDDDALALVPVAVRAADAVELG